MLNAFQVWMCKIFLKVSTTVPRGCMHQELGRCECLSVTVWGRAVMLYQRLQHHDCYHAERRILRLAAAESGTWTSTVLAKIQSLSLQPIPAGPELATTRSAIKLRLLTWKKKQLQPLLRLQDVRHSSACGATAKMAPALPDTAWTVYDLVSSSLPIAALQSWAQLKLQGYFRVPGHIRGGPSESCRLCGWACAETVPHLLVDCPATRSEVDSACQHLTVLGCMSQEKEAMIVLLMAGGPTQQSAEVCVRLAHALYCLLPIG